MIKTEKIEQMVQVNYRAYLKDFDFTANFSYRKNIGIKLELHKFRGVTGTFPDENSDYNFDWYLFALKISYNL